MCSFYISLYKLGFIKEIPISHFLFKVCGIPCFSELWLVRKCLVSVKIWRAHTHTHKKEYLEGF